MDNKSLVLRKVGGFYQTFDYDALIISYLFNYKVNNYRCGFPINVLNKVTNVLEEKKINYLVKGDEEIFKIFKKDNNYSKYLEKARIKDNINNRVNSILKKLEEMDASELEKVLTSIEEIIYEWWILNC